MNKLFIVGGAKGVGKTTLTTKVSLDCAIERVETGKILRNYFENPVGEFRDYLTRILSHHSKDLLLDTHFAQYLPQATKTIPFERGLKESDLSTLSNIFDIELCLIEVGVEELVQRRLKDIKKRVTLPEIVAEELTYNRRAANLYSHEINKPIFLLENKDFFQTLIRLSTWIKNFGGN